MKNIKNNKTILAVIPAVVVLAAGVAFFCSRSGNTDKQCQETVERLQKLETADISSIEDAIRALSEKEKPTGSDSEVFLAIFSQMYKLNRHFRELLL